MTAIENPYAPPQADLSKPSLIRQPLFFVVAPRKLVLMVLLSQGFYFSYWFYKQWACYRQATGAKIWPLLRAIFAVFFFYSLVMKVSKKLALDGTSHLWWPKTLALGLIICALLPFAYMWFVTSMTTLKLGICFLIVQVSLAAQVQGAVNRIEADPSGEANKHLTLANGVWILIGVSLWTLGFVVAVYESGLS